MIREIGICLAVAVAIAEPGSAQDFGGRNSITVSVGGEAQIGFSPYPQSGPGPSTNVEYEFRLFKYLAFDAGDEAWFPAVTRYEPLFAVPYGVNLLSTTPTSLILFPFTNRSTSDALHATVRGILPLANNRVELFLGVGPGYALNSGSPAQVSSGWVTDFEIGARFAIDKRRRFWLGANSNFLGNFSRNRQEWSATSVSFGFRFGK